MQDFYSTLPFLICVASVGIFIFIGASIFLVRDLRTMQQKHQEGSASLWHRRPRVRGGLKWMGYGLMIVLFAFGWGIVDFLPRNVAIISITGTVFVCMSINVVRAGNRLLRDLRRLQWERREGFSVIWYRRPKIMMRIGWLLFWCGPLLGTAYGEDMLLAHNILHQPLSENTAPLVITPGVFLLFAAAFYFYAILLEVLKRRTC